MMEVCDYRFHTSIVFTCEPVESRPVYLFYAFSWCLVVAKYSAGKATMAGKWSDPSQLVAIDQQKQLIVVGSADHGCRHFPLFTYGTASSARQQYVLLERCILQTHDPSSLHLREI